MLDFTKILIIIRTFNKKHNDNCYSLISKYEMGGLGKTTYASQSIHSYKELLFFNINFTKLAKRKKLELMRVCIYRLSDCQKMREISSFDQYKLVEHLARIQQMKENFLIVIDDICPLTCRSRGRPNISLCTHISIIYIYMKSISIC